MQVRVVVAGRGLFVSPCFASFGRSCVWREVFCSTENARHPGSNRAGSNRSFGPVFFSTPLWLLILYDGTTLYLPASVADMSTYLCTTLPRAVAPICMLK